MQSSKDELATMFKRQYFSDKDFGEIVKQRKNIRALVGKMW